ncbi:BTB/POZ domain-containing protein KCTD15-like [Nematostella vectensis]|uniref:BTB/POZ domain-containing protein KCTD15-like n=1 Tax=Nematostella vectensis TaxID=45351 RepID=UPI00138FBBD8|nr:BTB/POZ domain-containing protein KCTD15-like [Nematostella vectensis]
MELVKLNIGGSEFVSTLQTLTRRQSWFSVTDAYKKSPSGDYYTLFLDRDPKVFRHVLNFIRDERLSLPENFKEYELLLREATYYQIEGIREEIFKHRARQAEIVCLYFNQDRVEQIEGKKETLERVFPSLLSRYRLQGDRCKPEFCVASPASERQMFSMTASAATSDFAHQGFKVKTVTQVGNRMLWIFSRS